MKVLTSGGRLSNAWVTYLEVGDSSAKAGVIPRMPFGPHGLEGKGWDLRTSRSWMGPRSIS